MNPGIPPPNRPIDDPRGPHPIDVVPPPTVGSPTDMRHPVFTDDVPFWKPTWQDVIKHLGWRWVLLLPCVILLAVPVILPWRPALLQIFLVGGGKLLLITIGGAIGVAGAAIRSAVRQRKDPFCIHCGYDLIGLPDNHICPECGRPFSFRLIEEYRRDPHWFIQRYKARAEVPLADERFLAGPVKSRKSRDGT